VRYAVAGQPRPAAKFEDWLAQQPSHVKFYVVDWHTGQCCCPDFGFHRLACKHIFAVMSYTNTPWGSVPEALRTHARMQIDYNAVSVSPGIISREPVLVDSVADGSEIGGDDGDVEALVTRVLNDTRPGDAIDDSGGLEGSAADDAWEADDEPGGEEAAEQGGDDGTLLGEEATQLGGEEGEAGTGPNVGNFLSPVKGVAYQQQSAGPSQPTEASLAQHRVLREKVETRIIQPLHTNRVPLATMQQVRTGCS
jgi:hypothetical protein